MKKFLPLLVLLLVGAVAGLYGLNHYRELREQQREQTAQLLASCVNQGLLSLFSLQANDWRKQPDFYRQQAQKLDTAVAELPKKLLDGKPFAEWQLAVDICNRLTEHSNLQHRTIFRPLGDFASREMSDRGLKDREALEHRRRTIDRLKTSARAADRYLEDLRTDIHNQLQSSGLSAASRELAQAEINAQVLDYYRRGSFSERQVDAHLERVERYYQLLADNPRGFTLRGGGLYFYDGTLRREIDNLNSAILQGEAAFFANWSQLVQRQQRRIES